MASSINSPADVVNAALAQMGAQWRVSNLFDGSPAAKMALDIYGQMRDGLLRSEDWGFAQRSVYLSLLKQAPTGGYIPPNVWSTDFPPQGWQFEYAYPGDCLKLRSVNPATIFVPNFDPQPWIFTVANDDSFSPPQRVILTNAAAGIATYTGRVTDPTTWDVGFTRILIDSMMEKLAPALAEVTQGGSEEQKVGLGLAQQASAMAMNQG